MLPLHGIVVVTVEQAVAAPVCTRHLGDMGARVIKVENRAGGDFARGYDDYVKGMSAYFAWANRNKESVALDLKHPDGREVLARRAGARPAAAAGRGRLGLAARPDSRAWRAHASGAA
jgi:crotonobetainyl-CoA:carnitine CoA-transferase CaiB-like acyl-CoA transferase